MILKINRKLYTTAGLAPSSEKFWTPPNSEKRAKNGISKFICPSLIYAIQNSTNVIERINRQLLVKIGKNDINLLERV